MLERVAGITAKMAELRAKKWAIESDLIKLEENVKAVENGHCHWQHIDPNKSRFDFHAGKIPELRTRIGHLRKKHDVTEFNATLEKCAHDYEAVSRPYENLFEQLRKHCIAFRPEAAKLRAEVNSIKSTGDRIARIAELDNSITLKILIDILEDVRRLNEEDIRQLILHEAGKQLNAQKAELAKYFSNHLFAEILEGFDKFVKNDLTALAAKKTGEFMRCTVSMMRLSLFRKFHIKQMDEAQSDLLDQYLIMQTYLECTLRTFKFTDDIQVGNTAARVRFVLWLNMNEAYNPYVAVGLMAGHIRGNERTVPFLREAGIWLRGLYLNSLLQIPPFYRKGDVSSEEGLSYICDNEDRDLYKHKAPLTRMKLAVNDRVHYLGLSINAYLREQLSETQKSAWLIRGVQGWLLQQAQVAVATRLPLDIFLKIAGYVTGLTQQETADLYHKSRVAARKTYLLNDLHALQLFPGHANSAKTRNLRHLCEKASTRDELVNILDAHAKDLPHNEKLARHHAKLLELKSEGGGSPSMKLT